MATFFRNLTNSNRSGHLTAATLSGIAFAIGGLHFDTHWLITAAPLVPLWELIATPDMDHQSRRISGQWYKRLWVLYWWPYQQLIPHRSRYSHSLLIGSPVRFLYVMGPLWLVAMWALGRSGIEGYIVPERSLMDMRDRLNAILEEQ